MKVNQLLFLATAAAAVTSSCQKAPISEQELTKAVTFSSTISNQVTTKAAGANWESNDAIGVFMKTGSGLSNALASNKQYVTTKGDGNFSASSITEEINYPADGSNVDFIAYYPYQTTITNNIYPVNVADQTQQNKIDLLYANNVTGANKNKPNAQLQFGHKLSKVELTVAAGTGVSSLSGLTVTYNGFNTTANFDLATGTLAAGANPASIKAKTTAGTTTTAAEAILLPVASVAGAKVEFKIGNETYTWTLPSSTTYEAGKKYSYNITLQEQAGNNAAIVASGNITDWTDVPSGSYVIGKDEDNGGTTDPVEQTLYEEGFGTEKIAANTDFDKFTGWTNTAVKYTLDAGKLSIRYTGFSDNNIWVPANADAKFTVSDINTAGATKLKFKFAFGVNSTAAASAFDSKDIVVTFNGKTYSPASVVFSDANGYKTNTKYPLEIDLSAETTIPANSTISMAVAGTANTIGIRFDDLTLVGQK
ncbi:fimbrillin family protein [Sphingobacterium paramultivorum]|uniref:Fimbrillin family protein n=1 Tax=Sphingobacterium paramultivorum TaxID=2886510 RepID=A0A7G5E6P9_9SPHI|nr:MULTISPECIES: fimbrillin family protein [Sphingobacterium]QMV69674.1 fimbrillin family protein [Sphingobacterium paramultivorum]WET70703.1 MAG: fimbrillin family protein [Sphingobacterium sp.]WSO13490.1 fimbrillin family protein [Sphingobacterium paramultivorum]